MLFLLSAGAYFLPDQLLESSFYTHPFIHMSEEGVSAPTPAAPPHPVKPRSLKSLVHKNPLLRIFTIINAITILIAVLIGIAAVLSLIFIKTMSRKSQWLQPRKGCPHLT